MLACQLGSVATRRICRAAASFSDGEIKRFWLEAKLTQRLVPHGLVTFDLELCQD